MRENGKVMLDENPLDRVAEARPDVREKIDNEQIRRVLTAPEHENLPEAMAADAVDAAPILGDILAMERKETAEEKGMDYPSRPAFMENVISDLPEPIDTVGDIVISQNTLKYLTEKGD